MPRRAPATAPAVPPQFTGQARRLLDRIDKLEDQWFDPLQDKVLALGHRERNKRATTDRFVQWLHTFPPLGALGVEVEQKRRCTIVTLHRATATRQQMASWVESERALVVMTFVITIRPDHIGYAVHEPVSVSAHAVARAYQRMPGVNDAAVIEAIRPLIPFARTATKTPGSFSLNGWRGRVVKVEAIALEPGWEVALGVRTYLDKGSDEDE